MTLMNMALVLSFLVYPVIDFKVSQGIALLPSTIKITSGSLWTLRAINVKFLI